MGESKDSFIPLPWSLMCLLLHLPHPRCSTSLDTVHFTLVTLLVGWQDQLKNNVPNKTLIHFAPAGVYVWWALRGDVRQRKGEIWRYCFLRWRHSGFLDWALQAQDGLNQDLRPFLWSPLDYICSLWTRFIENDWRNNPGSKEFACSET